MKSVFLFITLIFIFNISNAAELTDCGLRTLDAGFVGAEIKKSRLNDSSLKNNVATHITAKESKKGQTIQYSKGDALLVAEVKSLIEIPSIKITPKLQFTSHTLLNSVVFDISSGETFDSLSFIKLQDSKEYAVIGYRLNDGADIYFFIGVDGRVCGSVLTTFSTNTSIFRWKGNRFSANTETVELRMLCKTFPTAWQA